MNVIYVTASLEGAIYKFGVLAPVMALPPKQFVHNGLMSVRVWPGAPHVNDWC
jgi:hypothetical protein